jgi:hypothetical protein
MERNFSFELEFSFDLNVEMAVGVEDELLRCSDCKELKVKTEFAKNSSYPKRKYSYKCKVCEKLYKEKRKVSLQSRREKINEKFCSGCKETKNTNLFSAREGNLLGFSGKCKKCVIDQRKKNAKKI